MKKKIIGFASLLLAAQAGATTTLLSDAFNTTSSGSVPGWTEIGSDRWGGVGVENTQNGSAQVYFQTADGVNATAGIYRSLGVTGNEDDTITISFDFGSSTGTTYAGVFTASLWDGTPGSGTLLGSYVPANQSPGVVVPFSFDVLLNSNTAGNMFVQFNAGSSGGGAFEQARLDNVLVTSIPEPSAALLGGLGLLALLRRRRA